MESQLMFLDPPAYLNKEGSHTLRDEFLAPGHPLLRIDRALRIVPGRAGQSDRPNLYTRRVA
jgi:hypothetical protein